MKPKFKIGDTVELNQEWAEANGGSPGKHYPVGRRAIINTGDDREDGIWRITFVENKTPSYFHESFLTKVRKP